MKICVKSFGAFLLTNTNLQVTDVDVDTTTKPCSVVLVRCDNECAARDCSESCVEKDMVIVGCEKMSIISEMETCFVGIQQVICIAGAM